MKQQKKVQRASTGFIPRKWQKAAFLMLKRRNILVFHRRGGKSVFVVNLIIHKVLNFNRRDKDGNPYRNPQFAYVATTSGQVEKIAWQYFKDYLRNIPGAKFNETKLRVTIPLSEEFGTATIFLFGAENFDAYRGMYLDGYVLDEYADMHPDVRDKVFLPMLSDREGWEVIIGTPKGEDAFKSLYDIAVDDTEEWFSLLVKASESGIIPEKELAALKKSMSKEAYAQEYECDWNAAPSGKYYQTYIDELRAKGQITKVPCDKTLPVMTFWDLGMSDSMVIWFIQEVGMSIAVIDYYEENGKGLEHYLEVIEEKAEKEGYRYGTIFLPHDASVRELTFGGKTRMDFFIENGYMDVVVCPRTPNVSEGIHAVRSLLPKCFFDKDKTHYGIKALANYQRKYDSKKQTYVETPQHDWASHGADGFRLFAENYVPGMSRIMGMKGQQFTTVLHGKPKTEYDILGR